MKILLIEDDLIETMKMRRTIAKCSVPHELILAEQGEEALEILRSGRPLPDILLLDLNVGRNMNEILRALEALQTADRHKVAMPLDWKKGDKVIVPPPKSLDELNARLADTTLEKVDWYLAKKALN